MSTIDPKLHGAGPQEPSAWLLRWCRLIRPGAEVLDFAAGSGRNVAPLLRAGARLTAVDRDAQALGLLDGRAERIVADLEGAPWPFAGRRFDAVICCNYLFRPRLDLLLDLVAPGGLMIYETFGLGNERYGRPRNPAFLLRPDELHRAAARGGLTVLGFEQGFVQAPKPALVQRVCAARPPFDPERYPLVG